MTWQETYEKVVEHAQNLGINPENHRPWYDKLKETLQWDDLDIHCLWTAIDEDGCFEMLRFDPRDCEAPPQLATIENLEKDPAEMGSVYAALNPGDLVRLVEGVFTIVEVIFDADYNCTGMDLGLTASQFYEFWNTTQCPESGADFLVRRDFLPFAPVSQESSILAVPLDQLETEEKNLLFSPWYATIVCPPDGTWRVDCSNVNFLEAYAIWDYVEKQYPREDDDFGRFIVPNLAATLLEAEDPQKLSQVVYSRGRFDFMGGRMSAYNWLGKS